MTHSTHNQPACHTGFAKPDLRFGRMHVYIHHGRITVQKQTRGRMAIARKEVHVSAAQSTDENFVPHRAAVHKQELRNRSTTGISRKCRVTSQVKAIAFCINRHCVICKFAAKNVCKAAMQCIKHITSLRICAKRHPTFTAARHIAQGKTDEGFGHSKALYDVTNCLHLGAVRPHEFQSCWRSIKQILQRNDGTTRQCSRLYTAHLAAADFDFSGIKTFRARSDRQTSYRPKRRKRFTAKPERVNVQKVGAINL